MYANLECENDNGHEIQTLELWFVWSFGRHKPEAGGFCLSWVNYTGRVKFSRWIGVVGRTPPEF
jgi:hypothetical protein